MIQQQLLESNRAMTEAIKELTKQNTAPAAPPVIQVTLTPEALAQLQTPKAAEPAKTNGGNNTQRR
ncbi:MAG: hypothetical protein U0Y68_20800 [Blastocatellia bacterium]